MKNQKVINRREFLRTSLTGVAGAGMLPGSNKPLSQAAAPDERPKIKGYRVLGRTGFKVSDIGAGTSFWTNVNVAEAALDMGINYLDTGEHYSGGNSERTIGEAIKARDRNSLFITTKLNLRFGGGDTKDILRNRFLKCLERLKTDFVDCLMIHMCTSDELKHENFHALARELKAEGKIKFIGLSNHGLEQRIYGNLEEPMEKVLLAAVEDGRFDVVLFVYNFLQKEQGEKIINACRGKDMGVTLMKTNPVKVYSRWKADIDRAVESGRTIPERIIKLGEDYQAWLKGAETFKTKYGLRNDAEVRDCALKFILSHPGVHTVCPSLNSFEDLEAFVRLSGQKLTAEDTRLLNGYESTRGRLYCRHACGTCEKACPHRVPVNTIMRYNHYFEAQGQEKYAMRKYAELERNKADRCRECPAPCETACPFQIPVQSLLVAAHHNLTLTS
ncbi:MAG: aldo/keto reductase [Candidatus Aminicenantes bacterium]|nr:aldo/keto reductase [Candidatus Aminicenantes bacterium]